ncbi:unnamed protein product, partial [Durusdinium trenchii]
GFSECLFDDGNEGFAEVSLTPEWVGLLVRAETPWQTQLGTYLLRAATFPLVSAIFMQMLPMNQCIWMTQCWIEAEGRSFQWFSTIPLYEGMFLQLHEILEQESEASTVCDSGSDDYSSHESNSNATESDNGVLLQVGWTESVARGNTATLSKQTPLTESPETPMLYEIKQQENTATCMGAQGDAFSRSKDGLCAALLDEHDGDTVGLMQLFSEQELQVVDGLDLEPPEHEVLQIDPGDIQASADVLRSYVYANFQVAHLPVVSVYTWVVTMGRPVESAARVCILQQRGSFTRVFSREWEDRHEGAVLSLSMSRPMMEPLTLRVQPIDLVAIPSGALDAGFRAYLLDLIGNFLPRRVAVACERSVTFNALRERLGMAEICLQPSTRCFLVHRDDRGTRVWEGLDQVQEPHGTAFHFVVEIMNECDDKKVAISGEIPAAGGQPGDNTATPWDFNSDQMVLMQRGVSSHSSRIDSRSASWGSQSSRTPEASQASGSGEAGTIESYPSTLRSRGPIDASSGEQLVNLEFEYNGVFNWVLTWGAVRRHVASYYLGGVEPHTEDVLVHIIQLHEGITTQGGYLCPSWILDVDQPVCTFIEWVEDHTFHFDPQVARAFPMIGELLQDTPVILVVDDLPIRRAVILVEVNFPDGHEIYICEPYRFERVSTILDWLDGFVEVPALTEQFYNGQRVVRWQTIETHPGGLFQVRVIPEDELANPLPATRTPNGSLEMQPHDTWSSILSLQEQGEQQGRVGNDPVPVSWPDEADETEEHTLMNLDVSTQVSFRRSEPSFFSVVDRQKVLSYLRGWFQGSGMVTIWVHSLPDNVVQEYPSVCEFDRVEASFAQCAESWVMVHAARLTFVHDIELHRGAFVQLYELTDDIDSDITECEDGNDIYTTDESDSGDEESLEGRFDFAVGFWQEGIQVVPITAEERQVDDLSYYEQDFREYQLWRERVRVALAYTQTFNLHQLLEEARAYHEARGVWPGLVACVVPNDWHKGTPGDAWLLDYESLVVYLREVLLDGFPVDQKVGLYAVKPFVTPLEQLGEDALYILVLLDPLEGERAILIVEDHWQSDHLQLWPIGVGELTDTWQVIEEAHRTIDYETTCILEYEMQELPRMVQWRTLPGMKLHLTISRDGGECELPLALDNDEVEMMQTTQHEPVYERQRVHLQRFNSVLRRGAVRCPLLATVAEIVKHFTGRQFPIDSPLLESFQLHWRSGGEVHVYHAFQIPAAPDGAFVHVVMRSTRVSQVLAQFVSDTCEMALGMAEDDAGDAFVGMQVMVRPRASLSERLVIDPLFRAIHGVQRMLGLDPSKPLLLTSWIFCMDGPYADAEGTASLLEIENGDWSETLVGSFEISAQWTFLVVQPQPPAKADVESDLHVLAFVHNEYTHLLVDLLLLDQTVRVAVQTAFDSTVLDVYRVIAHGRIRLWALLSTSFVMLWHAPEGILSFKAYEVPGVPSGSYVTMRVLDTMCLDDWSASTGNDRSRPDTIHSASNAPGDGGNTATPLGQANEYFEDSDGSSLLQRNVMRRCKRGTLLGSVEAGEQVGSVDFLYSNFTRLAPPGNPIWWLNVDQEKMDDYFCVGSNEIVLDYHNRTR